MEKIELIEKIKSQLDDDSYPDDFELPEDCVLEEIYTETLDERRWCNRKLIVYKINDWYLGFEWDCPSTECQEGQGTYPEIYEVEAYEKTETKYRRIKK